MWRGQKSRRTGHKKFVDVGSRSDNFAGLTFPIWELTPLVRGHILDHICSAQRCFFAYLA